MSEWRTVCLKWLRAAPGHHKGQSLHRSCSQCTGLTLNTTWSCVTVIGACIRNGQSRNTGTLWKSLGAGVVGVALLKPRRWWWVLEVSHTSSTCVNPGAGHWGGALLWISKNPAGRQAGLVPEHKSSLQEGPEHLFPLRRLCSFDVCSKMLHVLQLCGGQCCFMLLYVWMAAQWKKAPSEQKSSSQLPVGAKELQHPPTHAHSNEDKIWSSLFLFPFLFFF